MSPVVLFAVRHMSVRRMTALVVVTVCIILALPIGAVLALTNLPLLASGNPSAPNNQTIYTDPAVQGDRYDYGYCTYWAALRRLQIGDPIPNDWGDAITWGIRGRFAGYQVDHTPSYGAIFQWPAAPGGEGHVAFVERVDPASGAWTISEMNAVGWDIIDERTYPAADAALYNFIHDRVSVP